MEGKGIWRTVQELTTFKILVDFLPITAFKKYSAQLKLSKKNKWSMERREDSAQRALGLAIYQS